MKIYPFTQVDLREEGAEESYKKLGRKAGELAGQLAGLAGRRQ
jgi:hypothetical protein